MDRHSNGWELTPSAPTPTRLPSTSKRRKFTCRLLKKAIAPSCASCATTPMSRDNPQGFIKRDGGILRCAQNDNPLHCHSERSEESPPSNKHLLRGELERLQHRLEIIRVDRIKSGTGAGQKNRITHT